MTATDVPATSEPERPRSLSHSSKIDADIRERRRDMVATMLVCATPRRDMAARITEALGIHVGLGTIADDCVVIRRRWREERSQAWEQHVANQLGTLDRMIRAIMPKALNGETAAIDRALAILDRRARLLGLEQPLRLQADVKVTAFGSRLDSEIDELLDSLGRSAAIEVASSSL